MKSYTIAITIFLFFVNTHVQAQDADSDKLRWVINGLKDLNSNSGMSYSGAFVTDGTKSIEWHQTADEMTLQVISVSGSWADVSAPGSKIFTINVDGVAGTITFKKDSTGIFVLLNLSNGLKHRYTVSKIELLD